MRQPPRSRTVALYAFILILVLNASVSARSSSVELTADIEMTSWGASSYDDPPMVETALWNVRTVVGTNSWRIRISREGGLGQMWSYTGSNLLWQIDQQNVTNTAGGTQALASPVRSFEFDGDPESLTNGFLPPPFRIAWLAFCSGPFLSRTNREIPLPITIWKHTWLRFDHAASPAGFGDQTVQFDDELGLPISIDAVTKSGQPVFEYRLNHHRGPSPLSTNVLGWRFPLAFNAIQYMPQTGKSNTWQAYLFAKGALTSIKVDTAPGIANGLPADTISRETNRSYVLRAGGPQSYNLINNPPEESRATITLRGLDKGSGRIEFTVRNGEPEEILLWNMRVQVKSSGRGTDGFGWDTVFDDTPNSDEVILAPAERTELRVSPPSRSPWRVCVLYSKQQKDAAGNKVHGGHYESISEHWTDDLWDRLDPLP